MPRITQALISFQLISGSMACFGPAVAQDPAPSSPAPSAVVETLSVPFETPSLWLELPLEVQENLSKRRYSQAAEQLQKLGSTPSTEKAPDLAFLRAWCLARAGRAKEAGDLLKVFQTATRAPADYLALTKGEILLANGDPSSAAQTLSTVPDSSRLYPQARVLLARALQDTPAIASEDYQGPVSSRKVLIDLTSRADPAESSDEALWRLAKEIGLKTEEAYPLLRRVWAFYPTTQ